MKIFLDSANLKEIESVRGFIDGVTTNPTLVAKELGTRDKKSVYTYYQKILALVDGPVSLEVTEETYEGMVKQAKELAKLGGNVVVKVPVTSDGLRVVRTLSETIPFNVTLVMNVPQAIAAQNAGADYISPFIGRLDDYGSKGLVVLKCIRETIDSSDILAASIRSVGQIDQCFALKVDCMTVPYTLLKEIMIHPKTDEGLKKFMEDWNG